ncbi:hypothetical protein ACLESD_09215 [Pyxidicoccus sp. 3LFB2]
MADSLLTSERGAWVRTVARWMKAWADSVLDAEARPGSTATSTVAPRPESRDSTSGSRGAASTPVPAVAAAPAPSMAATPEDSLESLEARWLRDIEARRRVPMADWAGRVTNGATHPPRGEGPSREPRVAPPPSRQPVDARGAPPPSRQSEDARGRCRPRLGRKTRVPRGARCRW